MTSGASVLQQGLIYHISGILPGIAKAFDFIIFRVYNQTPERPPFRAPFVFHQLPVR